jgi:pyruvate-formate lyase-activating enzyme
MDKNKIFRAKEIVNGISPSFCLAKWLQTTLYLHNGYNHSCHHPTPHKIPLEEVVENPKALHNTKFKKDKMKEMLEGIRPPECEYCWKIEDLGKDYISDRYYKSGSVWALENLGKVMETKLDDIEPTYLEISFSNVCNFKCLYCSPEISSTWMKEIQHYGAYPTSGMYNNLENLKIEQKIPYDPNENNPYVDAFWKWWPDLYPKLHTLRLTGGEPLMSRDVWKIIDNLIENPNPKLTFCINTNLCVQDRLIDTLIDKINKLTGKVKEIQIFSSGEATGQQAEYIRYGLNYTKWIENMHKISSMTSGNIIIANMTTVNLLSYPTFSEFIEEILNFREKYNKNSTHNKIQFMINYLRYPQFLSLPNLDEDSKQSFKKSIEDLIYKRGENYKGLGKLSFFEIDQLRRLIDYTLTEDASFRKNRKDFYIYINEVDKRRNLDFLSTFTQLEEYYKICQTT